MAVRWSQGRSVSLGVGSLLIVLVLCSLSGAAGVAAPVHVLSARGTVDQGLSAYICRGVAQAAEEAAAVVVEIDTWGGRVDAAVQIRDCLVSSKIPVFTFVTSRAWSAGALIALAGSKMAMAAGSSIGAAEPRPSDAKTVSALRGEFEATAERFGRDPLVAAAMVDARVAIPGVVEVGELLTLRAGEAHRLGIAELVAPTKEALVEEFVGQSHPLVAVPMNWGEKAARVLTSPSAGSLLLAAAAIGLLVEILTPGWGLPGIVSLASLALFFGGRLVVGLVGWEVILLFIIGLVLLLLEVFVIPGFGVAGVAGIGAVLTSLFLSFPDPHLALQAIAVAGALTVAAGWLLLRQLSKGGKGPWNRVVLGTRQEAEEGYVAGSEHLDLLGKEAVASSVLRPSGVIEIEGRRVDAVSEGAWIAAGRRVQVVSVQGSRIVVREV
jgi:membrane-bound serine protease (ClpP class)